MSKKILTLISLILTLTMAFTLTACKQNNAKTIAVVAKGESHAFWQSVKKGATDAAEKYGYTITFRGPASESAKDLPSQIEMVQSALSNDPKGLVIATIGEGFTDLLKQALGRLNGREREIMELRYGLNGLEEKTQKEVADMLGISQSYISRLEKKIIGRLQKEFARMI